MAHPLVRGFLAEGRAGGDPADPAAGARHQSRRLSRADRAALRQPQDRRHHPPALPRRLEPPAEVHHPLGRRPPRPRPAGRRASRSPRRCGAATARARPTAAPSIEPNDPSWDRLQAQARAARSDPMAWLGMTRHLRAQRPRRRRSATPSPRICAALWADGTAATLAAVRSTRVTAPPGLVIFDCDGVLVDSEPIAMRILLDTLAEAGPDARSRDRAYDRFLGRSLAEHGRDPRRRTSA